MKTVFKQYFKIMGYALTGLAFGFAFFFLFLNFYHYLELRRTIVFNASNDATIIQLDKTLGEINDNISEFSYSGYKGSLSISEASKINNSFKSCLAAFKNETITEIRSKKQIDIRDVYNLRNSYDSDIISKCIINNFIWLSSAEDYEDEFIKNMTPFNKDTINNLIYDTDFIKSDLLNNSSYFFNTDISSKTVKNFTGDNFYGVLSSYNKVANYLKDLSIWYKSAIQPIETVIEETNGGVNND